MAPPSPAQLPKIVVTSLLIALVAATGANAQTHFETGTYVGNATDNRSITGVGFQPDVVMIKSAQARHGVIRTSTMIGDLTKKPSEVEEARTNRVQSLDADGFTIGTNDAVNTSGETYYWVAFAAEVGALSVGDYVGDSVDNRDIGGVGFQPDYVIIMDESAQESVNRSSAMPGDLSFKFRAGPGHPDFIQVLNTDGFQVGQDNRVNRSGDKYHYIAWAGAPGRLDVGSYVGDGVDDRIITTGLESLYLHVVGTENSSELAHRSIDVPGDSTMAFENLVLFPDAIQQLLPDGFEIGTDNTVNTPTRSYYWVSFGESVNEAPVCDAGGPYAGDVGEGIAFDGTASSDADGSIVTYAWDFGDGGSDSGATPSHTYVTGGLFTVTLCVTDDDGAESCCTTTADVNVVPICGAGGPYAANEGDSIAFDGTGSSDPDGTIVAFDWDFGDGSIDTGATPTHVYASGGLFTVTLCVTDDDGGTACCSTTADINALPVCDAGGPYAAAVGQIITFDGSGSSDDGNISDYAWDFGDGNTGNGAAAQHVYATGGSFTVTLCVTDDDAAVTCCTTLADINAPPTCDAGGPYAGNAGDSIAFDGSASADADGTITGYAWDFGDGGTDTGATPSHTYTAGGIFTVTLCVTDDDGAVSCCASTADINALPACDAGGPYAGNPGDTIAFDGSASVDPDGTIVAYDWDFGDGSTDTGATPSHVYATFGLYTVTLCLTDDEGAVSCCTTTADINEAPVCDAGGPYTGNTGEAVLFDGTASTDADGTIAGYAWDFGDGETDTGATPSHIYVTGGAFTVTLCVTDDDGAESCCTTTADINEAPTCDAGGPYAGDVDVAIAFDGSASADADGTITGYAWDFGDGATDTGATPSHTYVAGGLFTVTLCVIDDDGAESCCTTTADINAPPTCDAGGPYAGGLGDPVQFDGTASSEPGGAIVTYAWEFGDGEVGSGPTPLHAYAVAAVYTVTLCVTDDDDEESCCTTTASIDNALPLCDAGGPYAGGAGEDIQFDGSASSDPDGSVVAHFWDFGDGANDSGATPLHAYATPGVYVVTLCVTDDDGAIVCCETTADINDPPLCDAGGPYDGLVGDVIAFDGSASGDPDGSIVSYDWDYGDGETGTGESPSHTYTALGLYTVTLCVTDDDGATACCSIILSAREWTDVTSGAIGDTGNGRGVAWGDYDGDGDHDVYLANSGANKLFDNQAGSFFDVTPGNLADTGDGQGVAWADYDSDGDLDLYHVIGSPSPNLLYRNDGGGAFTEVAAGTPAGDTGRGRSFAWVDHDLDGDLDIYVANAVGANRLLRNDAGAFVVSGVLEDTNGSQGVAWADHDLDGDADLFVANGNSANRLYRNDGSEVFVDIAPGTALEDATAFSLGCVWGDIENDGDPDLYVTNNSGPNRLFRNDGDAGGGLWTFTEAASGTPLADTGDGRSVVCADLDNDADLDFYIANVNGANKHLRNEGAGVFVDATFLPLDDAGDSFGLAAADYDGDGDLDLYVANSATENRLYRNDVAALDQHWLQLDLQGVMSNLSAVGARVRIVTAGTVQTREVSGGSGWLSQESLTLEFGLGAATVVDSLSVFWPSGLQQDTVLVAVDQRVFLVEHETTTGVEEQPVSPLAFRLHQNVPNPFNPTTEIRYDLARAAAVRLSIIDVSGRVVRQLVAGEQQAAGSHSVVWDGRGADGQRLASGVYLYRLEADGRTEIRRMLLLK